MRNLTREQSERAIRSRRSRKGQLEYNVAMLGVELVILAVVLWTLTKIITNMIQPHFQIAYANAELLRSTIDSLCAQGSGSAVLEDWNFPQPMPLKATTGGIDVGKNILPKFMIKAKGDPSFLLYYEAFPPPFAFGWELYQNVGERVVAPLRDQTDISNANATVMNYLEVVRSVTGDKSVIIPNIILGDKSNESFLPGSVGSWTDEELYSLSGYGTLSELEKSLVKYRACGDYTLCMKTGDSIIKLELPNCKAKGIDYIRTERSDWDKFEDLGLGTLEAIGFSAVDIATVKAGGAIQGVGTVTQAAKAVVSYDGKQVTRKISTKALQFAANIISIIWKKPWIMGKFAIKTVGKVISGVGIILLIKDLAAGLENIASGIAAFFFDTSTDFYVASPCKMDMTVSITSCPCDDFQELKLFEYDKNGDTLKVAGDYKTCWDKISGAPGTSESSPQCVLIEYEDSKGYCRTNDVLLPLSGMGTSIGQAAEYDPALRTVKLLSGENLAPGFISTAAGWVWPGER